MYIIWLMCNLLAGLGAPAPTTTVAVAVTRPAATPEEAFTALYADVAALIRKALAESSDASALAMLRSQTPALLKRGQQLRPAYNKWLMGLSPAQAQAMAQRLQNSPSTKYLASVESDPKTKARLAANAPLADAVSAAVGAMNMTE